MGYSKPYKGLNKLPEVIELRNTLLQRGYVLNYCENMGLRMQKYFTEIHFIPEDDRLRICIHDDGMGEKETDIALNIAKEIVLKYGYKQGENKFNIFSGYEESDDEFYKYFDLYKHVVP
jgi:hypothetical protein